MVNETRKTTIFGLNGHRWENATILGEGRDSTLNTGYTVIRVSHPAFLYPKEFWKVVSNGKHEMVGNAAYWILSK